MSRRKKSEIEAEKNENIEKSTENGENSTKDEEESTPKAEYLAEKDLFRVDEVADYFGVNERTIRLWIDHGHLEKEKVVGSIRISRKSILRCRFGDLATRPQL